MKSKYLSSNGRWGVVVIVANLNGGLRFCWHHLIQRALISTPQISHCAANLSSHLIILPAAQPKSKTRFPSRNEKPEELAILTIVLTCVSPKLRYSSTVTPYFNQRCLGGT